MFAFQFSKVEFEALPSGGLFLPAAKLLVVSDLHLGKSERIARRSGQMLPPYETIETLDRLDQDLTTTKAKIVICLGDSFDDLTAGQDMADRERLWLMRLMAGRQWIWIEGNHDPGPLEFGGTHLHEYATQGLTFRHIAQIGAKAEISGHYHPKAQLFLRGRSITRPCFLLDENRLILPAYGAYTGGLRTSDPALQALMQNNASAILAGAPMCQVPMPR